jgi:hypothetical protein
VFSQQWCTTRVKEILEADASRVPGASWQTLSSTP